MIVNACTKILCYKQKGTDSSFHLEDGKHSYIQWMDSKRFDAPFHIGFGNSSFRDE